MTTPTPQDGHLAPQNTPVEAQALGKQVMPPYLAYEIARALSPMCTSPDQFIYMKQIVTETIEKHIEWVVKREADTKVITAASERPEANNRVEKNAPESVDTPLKDTEA